MPVETNMLMSFLERVNEAQRRRQQEAQEQAPAVPEMPEWSKRLNPDDFKGTTREMLMAAQSAAPGTANQMGKGDLDLMPQQPAPSPDVAVRDGIGQVMEEEQQRLQQRQQPAPAMPAPMDPGVMRDPNRPQQTTQRQTPEPAAELPRQQNPAPATPQGGQPVNLRKALGPYVGDGGDFVAMAQRARRTGEMPGGRMAGGQGQATATGSGGSDTLAGGPAARPQPTASRGAGGGLFGGSGPGLGYAIGGIGALLQEASGQQGAAGRFAQTYGERYQQQRLSNQTRQLAIDYGVDPHFATNAPIEAVNSALGDKYNQRNAGPQYEYKDGQWYEIGAQGPTPHGEPNQASGTPKLATFELADGSVQTVDMGSPDGRSRAHQIMAQGGTEVRTPATQVNIGTGDQTAGQKKADEAFGDEYQSWVTGGFADVQSQLGKLDEVTAALESGAELSGPAIGIAFKRLPPDVFAARYPEAQAALDTASEVIQRTLRETLGAQFTENEAERFIARSYNMSLPPQENAKRMRQASETLRRQAAAKNAAVKYFGEHGSLTGFDYQSVPSGHPGQQTNPPPAGQNGQQQDAPPEGVDPEDWKYMTPEERALWQ